MPDQSALGAVGTCPDLETLAAFADGQLPEAERLRVQAHLGQCDTCYDLVTQVALTSDDVGAAGPRLATVHVQGERVVNCIAPLDADVNLSEVPLIAGTGSKRLRRWGYTALGSGLALAATLLLIVQVQPTWWQREWTKGNAEPHIATLVSAMAGVRIVEPRLTGGFGFASLRGRTRAGNIRAPDNVPLLAAARELQKTAQTTPTPENLHAWGVAQLLVEDYDGSVAALESAQRERPFDAAYTTDLAAALLARGLASGGDTADLTRARSAVERALKLDPTMPEAWFNKALVYTRMNDREQAAAAWDRTSNLIQRQAGPPKRGSTVRRCGERAVASLPGESPWAPWVA